MAPDICNKIVRDIKASWYFRVYAVTGLVMLIVLFIGMSRFDNETRRGPDEQDSLHMSLHSETQIAWPDFRFRVGTPAQNQLPLTIQSVECVNQRDNTNVPGGPTYGACAGVLGQKQWCLSPEEQNMYATPDDGTNRNQNRMECIIITNAENCTYWDMVDDQVAFELTDSGTIGPNSYASIWIKPSPATWIMMSKRTITQGQTTTTDWDRDLMYHNDNGWSDLNPPVCPLTPGCGCYQVELIMNTFNVINYQDGGIPQHFDPWLSAAATGGFMALLFIVHWLFMTCIVGFVLVNDSETLGGDAKHTSTTTIDSSGNDFGNDIGDSDYGGAL